ncbi:MAG: nucleotidyltransferase family protein [Stackebrandtia sp.]
MTAEEALPAAGLVLAAGAGRRMGIPKALVEYDGQTLLDVAVGVLRDGGCAPVYAVLGAEAERARSAARRDFVSVFNPDWPTGMGSSLRRGLEVLPHGCAAVVVTLVDQPWLSPEAVARLRRAHARGARVAAATYGGRRGHPVLFDSALWSDVADTAHGDVGARDFLKARPELVVEVACDGLGEASDVDTYDDLRRRGSAKS